LRRSIILTVALAALIVAGVASATTPYTGPALNTYKGVLKFSPNAAGTAAKPAPLGFNENLTAANTVKGLRAAPLTDIKLTMYGLKVDTKAFPVCTATFINAKKSDSACPKGSLVATGPITAELGDTTLQGAGTACSPLLHVYNGGAGNVVFFFVIKAGHTCGSLQTGSTAPYVGTIKQVGRNLVQDTPLPPDVSTKVAGLTFYGSLELENLTWTKHTTKVGGKTASFVSSVGCKAGKRPYTVAFTATNGTISQTETVKGSQKC
jgi:hypothetical protein